MKFNKSEEIINYPYWKLDKEKIGNDGFTDFDRYLYYWGVDKPGPRQWQWFINENTLIREWKSSD